METRQRHRGLVASSCSRNLGLDAHAMPSPPPADVTELLIAWRDGDRGAFDALVPLLYDDLRRLARAQLRRHMRGMTIDTTGLVHEAFVRLVDGSRVDWQDRGHFLAVSAHAMRQVIIGFARRRTAAKRGGGERPVTFDAARFALDDQATNLLALDEALQALGRRDARLVRVVECRFFAGLSEQETADALGTSLRTAQRSWKRARALLREALEPGDPPTPPEGV